MQDLYLKEKENNLNNRLRGNMQDLYLLCQAADQVFSAGWCHLGALAASPGSSSSPCYYSAASLSPVLLYYHVRKYERLYYINILYNVTFKSSNIQTTKVGRG